MLTLDTIFVLPQFRRKGFVVTLLSELVSHEDNVGFSSPVSNRMCAGNEKKKKKKSYSSVQEL